MQNGILTNNQGGIILYKNSTATTAHNRCVNLNAVVQCLDLFGGSSRFLGNYVEGGQTGLLIFGTTDPRLEGNMAVNAAGCGLAVASCEDKILLENNKVSSCGLTGQSAIEANLISAVNTWNGFPTLEFGTAVAAGIAVVNCAGLVSIEGYAR